MSITKQILFGSVTFFICALFLVFSGYPQAKADDKSEFDRLDGTGNSGKRVDVIEWKDNLELHIYPQGSLAGLALEIDRTNKGRPVMIIGYRFNHDTEEQLIRRAILSKDFKSGFETYISRSDPDMDKILITEKKQPSPGPDYASFELEGPPAHHYPKGHPLREIAESHAPHRLPTATPTPTTLERQPATRAEGSARPRIPKFERTPPAAPSVNEHGSIESFHW
jgi:hypothetical protein